MVGGGIGIYRLDRLHYWKWEQWERGDAGREVPVTLHHLGFKQPGIQELTDIGDLCEERGFTRYLQAICDNCFSMDVYIRRHPDD